MAEIDNYSYNKALEDFYSAIKLEYLGVHPDELYEPHYAFNIVDTITNIKEQLKAGVN